MGVTTLAQANQNFFIPREQLGRAVRRSTWAINMEVTHTPTRRRRLISGSLIHPRGLSFFVPASWLPPDLPPPLGDLAWVTLTPDGFLIAEVDQTRRSCLSWGSVGTCGGTLLVFACDGFTSSSCVTWFSWNGLLGMDVQDGYRDLFFSWNICLGCVAGEMLVRMIVWVVACVEWLSSLGRHLNVCWHTLPGSSVWSMLLKAW